MFDIESALRTVVEMEGSDLHVKVGSPPISRVDGHLSPLDGAEPLTDDDTQKALERILHDQRLRTEFTDAGEVDFAFAIENVSRFRVNAFRQRGSISIACRAIPYQVRTIDDLGLPEVTRALAEEPRGIILLTGTTGSGKSTTLAAMIDHINETRSRHVVTLEDPIEYLHRDKQSVINQREVGSDTQSFAHAMRRVLRQDPDVILIGEMRDEETVRTALSAAETGHLVLSTLHTLDASETINRIIDFFPPHLQQQARVMLASTLRAAISQRLVPRVGGIGRIAVAEIMVSTGRVQDLILNPEETGRITEVIAEGSYYGMQTFDQALLGYVSAGLISEEVALDAASSPHDFKLMLAAHGQRASGIEQVMGNGDAPAAEPTAPPAPTRPAKPPAATEPAESPAATEPADEPAASEADEQSPAATEPAEPPASTEPEDAPAVPEADEHMPAPTEPGDVPAVPEADEQMPAPTEPTESPAATEPAESPAAPEPAEPLGASQPAGPPTATESAGPPSAGPESS